jgi:hypothetical protein
MVANHVQGLVVCRKSFTESLQKSGLTHFISSPNVHSLHGPARVRVHAGDTKTGRCVEDNQ